MTEPTPSPLNNVITIDNSVEEDLIEMYLAGISECAVSKTSRKPYGARGYRSRRCQTMNRKIYGTIEAWRDRPIEGEHPYVYLDGIVLKRSWAGVVRNVSLGDCRERRGFGRGLRTFPARTLEW